MAIADYDRPAVRVWLIWFAAGIAICTGFWWLMANVLLLRMPAGLLF
jgi:putative tricarboxylic transport membrane protein